MTVKKKAAKTKIPKKEIEINLAITLRGADGIKRFGEMMKALYENGFESEVRALVRMYMNEAKKHGVKIPLHLEKFCRQERPK